MVDSITYSGQLIKIPFSKVCKDGQWTLTTFSFLIGCALGPNCASALGEVVFDEPEEMVNVSKLVKKSNQPGDTQTR